MKSKILSLLLSFAIAFGLWLYVITVVDPESEAMIQDVPVILDGENALNDRDLMILSKTGLTVDLKLLGNRADLNKLNASNITLLADLSHITQPGEHNVKYSVFYPSGIQSGNIEVLEQSPQNVTIVVAERGRKEIPVKLDWTGSVPEGYEVDIQNAQLGNTTITVTGPKETIDRIDHARVTVDLTGKTSNIVEAVPYTLCDSENLPIEDLTLVTPSVTQIRMSVTIHRIKQIPVEILVEDGGGITKDMVTVTPSLNNIVVSGSETALAKLGDKILLGPIQLGELEGDTTLDLTFELPEGVTLVEGDTKVSVQLDLPEMGTRTFLVTNFRTENVPEDRRVDIKSAFLHIKVRGPVEILNQMHPGDIVIVVDCQGVSLPNSGNITLEAKIQIPGVENVGAVGEYDVSVYVGTIVPSGTGG